MAAIWNTVHSQRPKNSYDPFISVGKKKKIALTEVNTVTDLNCMDHHDRKKKVVTLNSWLYKPNTPRSLKFMRATQR